MDLKLLATVFGTVFLAELGDKTQLATMLYAADAQTPKLTVFAGSAAALVLTFTLFPVAYNVWLGFYAKHSLRATSVRAGLENYAQILADPDFWRSTYLATVYAVASTALQIVAGVAGALILHQRFPGCDFLRGVAGTGQTRYVALTGFGQPADRQQSECAGFDAHLVKPVELETLFGTIARLQQPE